MKKDSLAGEDLCVFEKKAKEKVNKIKEKLKLVIEDLMTHFFPNKALQYQKRYPLWGLFKTQRTKMN